MTRSQELFERAQKRIPGGVNSPVRAFKAVGGTPLFIAKAEGARVTDADGKSYIDYVGSWGPMILGHAHPAVVEAVKQAAARGTSYGAPCEAEVELAERVCRFVPSIEKVRFVSSGTEATMSALRAARGFTGRRKIVKFDGCYHGHADGLLVAAGSGVATLGLPGSKGVPEGTVADTIVLPFNDLHALEEAFVRHEGQIAAVIVEPVCGNMGCVGPAPWVPAGDARPHAARGHGPHLRRGHDGLPPRPRGRAAALRHHPRHDLPRQDRRRGPARRGLRGAGRDHERGGAARPRVPGGHALGQSAGHGGGRGPARSPEGRGHLRAAGGALRAAARRPGASGRERRARPPPSTAWAR